MTESKPDETKPEENVDRLLKHLKEDSFAARLVHAHRAPGRTASMMAVLTERLQQVRESLDGLKT
jgi:hypothetical protein